MPLPIQTINDRPVHQQYQGLADALHLAPAMLTDISLDAAFGLTKESAANDQEAETLFKLWEQSRIVTEAEVVSERVYEVPSNFSPDDIMRLKTGGLITGDSRHIHFTERAARVIRTMVLAENNNYQKQAIKKPYSLILAESKKPRRKNNLAFASDNMVCLGHAKIIKQAAKHDKIYIVRVYDNPAGGYDVWAFNGRYGGTLQVHPKGHFDSLAAANYKMTQVAAIKMSGGAGSNSDLHGMTKPNAKSVYIDEKRLRYVSDSSSKGPYKETSYILPNGTEPPGVTKAAKPAAAPKAPNPAPKAAPKVKPLTIKDVPSAAKPQQVAPTPAAQSKPAAVPPVKNPQIIDTDAKMEAFYAEYEKRRKAEEEAGGVILPEEE